MLSKIFNKNTTQQPPPAEEPPPEKHVVEEALKAEYIDPRIVVHYGIPSTASILAFDPIQSLLAVGTLDGRIKVIGGSEIEGLLVSPKLLPIKYLEFLHNQGFLVSITNDNEIQVWDLELRRIASTLQWESNITAFSVIKGSNYMYVGDEYGMVSVVKYDAEEVILMPYYVPTNAITEASGMSSPKYRSVVGVLPQPSSQGNRLLIAYEDGLIVLWDNSEDKVILVRGNRDLRLKSEVAVDCHGNIGNAPSDDRSEDEQLEKEISALCWASSSGSILVVGYVDGDLMLWNLSNSNSAKHQQAEKSSNNVVKLQLSSGDRRLPVIVLRWLGNRKNISSGQLFVYGGEAMGSEEVLTILNLDWSSGIEKLKCNGRVDLTLNGSFADMVLLSPASAVGTGGALILTNPGELHFYDCACLSSLISKQEKTHSVSPMQYQMVVLTTEPNISIGKIILLQKDVKISRAFSEVARAPVNTSWPLTGGVPSLPFDAKDYQIARLYLAGYQDGSVRLWDATYPSFSLIYVLEPQVKGINLPNSNVAVSAMELCTSTLTLAIGNVLGTIHLYKLMGSSVDTSLKMITESGEEVHNVHRGEGPQCTAVFSFVHSSVSMLQFADTGTRLLVGFHCGQVAMLDISTLSLLFLTNSVSTSCCPVNFLASQAFSDTVRLKDIPKDSKPNLLKWQVYVATNDGQITVIDGNTGSTILSKSLQLDNNQSVISVYTTGDHNQFSEISNEKLTLEQSQEIENVNETDRDIAKRGSTSPDDQVVSAGTTSVKQSTKSLCIFLCSVDSLALYDFKSLKEDGNPIRRINLSKPCCWTSTFKKDDKEWLFVLYQTGEFEIRVLPDLEVVKEDSIMSILRWNFRTNMEKTISLSNSGLITLVNGCEFACVSLLAKENEFRIPESFPCLHDKVVAAAADAAFSVSPRQKIVQDSASGILSGLIKGIHGGKVEYNQDLPEVCGKDVPHLESLFCNPPYLKPSPALVDDQKVLNLNIDDIDIDIDEPLHVTVSSSNSKNDTKDKGTERDRLFEGATTDPKPRVRTAEEIKAKYRKEDASAAAARAKEKLAERGEKLERLSLRTEELQSGAQDFASMAQELAKRMEKRKWWNI